LYYMVCKPTAAFKKSVLLLLRHPRPVLGHCAPAGLELLRAQGKADVMLTGLGGSHPGQTRKSDPTGSSAAHQSHRQLLLHTYSHLEAEPEHREAGRKVPVAGGQEDHMHGGGCDLLVFIPCSSHSYDLSARTVHIPPAGLHAVYLAKTHPVCNPIIFFLDNEQRKQRFWSGTKHVLLPVHGAGPEVEQRPSPTTATTTNQT
ncbi:hypothetical protein P4O66_014296, partial [Electrophorus voltai]